MEDRVRHAWWACVLVAVLGCAAAPEGAPGLRRVPPDATGEHTTYWADDRPRETGTYLDGRRHGEVTGYHPDGSLAFRGRFEHGLPIGVLQQWNPGGVRRATSVVVDDVAERVDYHASGQRARRATSVGGMRHGVETLWHDNGTLAQQGRYDHGLPVGRWVGGDPNGRKTIETWYWRSGDAVVGYLETTFAPDGRVTTQGRWRQVDEGWLGQVSFWHGNGRQAGLVEYAGGLRQGRDLAWDEQGVLRAEGRRNADLREGRWVFRDEGTSVDREVVYDSGRPLASAGP